MALPGVAVGISVGAFFIGGITALIGVIAGDATSSPSAKQTLGQVAIGGAIAAAVGLLLAIPSAIWFWRSSVKRREIDAELSRLEGAPP